MELLRHFARQFGHEVHEHVAAEYNVKSGRVVEEQGVRIFSEVQIGKSHHFSYAGEEFKTPILLLAEVSVLYPWRVIAEGPMPVYAGHGFLQGLRIDVGCQNVDVPLGDIGNHTA